MYAGVASAQEIRKRRKKASIRSVIAPQPQLSRPSSQLTQRSNLSSPLRQPESANDQRDMLQDLENGMCHDRIMVFSPQNF